MNDVIIQETVAVNLRRHRAAAGLSLQDLATAADIAKSTLHALELGEGNPTLSTLWALATALGVPLGDLLAGRPADQHVVRAAEGARIDGEAVHARLLHRLDVRGTIEIYDLAIDRAMQESAPHRPGVLECLIVTSGGVRAGLGARAVDLAPGDSIRHDAAHPHVYQGLTDDNRALLLMIYS
jgi:transcriptional regulator with XRE-family HTH domain